MALEISNLRKVNHGKLKAFFSVTWPDKMTIHDMKLMEGNDGNLWAATPARQYEKDGQKKWTHVVQVHDQGLLEKITMAARAAYGEPREQEPPADIPF